MMGFIGLNPSTADETTNDNTIRRCIQFAKDWGFSGLVMLNLFGFRSTDPKWMKKQEDPSGPENVRAILEVCQHVPLVVCAWGTHGAFQGHGRLMRAVLTTAFPGKIHHLGLTKGGYPKHPLYLPKTLEPVLWSAPYDAISLIEELRNAGLSAWDGLTQEEVELILDR